MNNLAIIGLQWGDEGKGKIVDYFTKDYQVIVRFQGGPNAGHTVYVDDKKYVFHQLPSGLLWGHRKGIISPGVVLDLELLLEEIKQITVDFDLLIDYRTHVILPYHRLEDELAEKLGGIGSTRKGISQAYRDKYARLGIRVFDILDEKRLKERLLLNYNFNKAVLTQYNFQIMPFDEIYEYLLKFKDFLKKHTVDTQYELLKIKDNILFEGAQGVYLDINFGTYPYVTSSHSILASIGINCGFPLSWINKKLGVFKAYTTRVGQGPFPTEMDENLAEIIRHRGNEYGATTGRPRRCGWLDLVLLKQAVLFNEINQLALTKIDVLFGLDEVKVAIAYKVEDKIIDYLPFDLSQAQPVYKIFKGFQNIDQARDFLNFIEEYLSMKINFVSYGVGRNDILLRI